MKNDFLQIPKIENHIHLEGAIPHETLWQLIQKYEGNKSGIKNLNELKERFTYRDFNHFIEMWIWKNQYIREYEDFRIISEAVFRDLAAQNILYAEIFISPSLFKKKLSVQKIIEIISESRKIISGIKINLIADLVRDYGQEQELKTLFELSEVKDSGIIGIGIGGSENKYPAELFTDLFEQARKFGFKTTAHAGEASGPESIWSAIKNLRIDRIGHGTRAVEDVRLLNYLAEKKIPLELCPISNVRTRVIKSVGDHPIKTFIERGIPVSVNTDDPKMFDTSLAEEYKALQDAHLFTDDEIFEIILKSVETTWLSRSEKKELADKLLEENAISDKMP